MNSTYTPGAAVTKRKQELDKQLSTRPGDYESQWGSQLRETLDRILTRPDFSYDPGSDPLYRQYRDRYQQQGRLAMTDTLGRAQAMTGGYGSSYAQTAAQQTYHQYLQGLNDQLPQLTQLALDRYRLEGEGLKDRLTALSDRESADYGRYQDLLSQWETDRNYLAAQYRQEQTHDLAIYESLRDYALKQTQAAQEQQRWQAEFEEAKRRYDQDYAQKQVSASASSSSGGSGKYSNGGADTEAVKAAQRFVGTTADGMWGANSKKAAKAMGYSSLEEVLSALGKRPSSTTQPSPPSKGGALGYVNLAR